MTLLYLTKASFKSKIFDFEKNKEWEFKGNKPAIIDFYADWCMPCKMVSSVLEELKEEYGEKLNFYKVNTEEEKELSTIFGIQSIPSLLFIPFKGQPQMINGALPKEAFQKVIHDILQVV